MPAALQCFQPCPASWLLEGELQGDCPPKLRLVQHLGWPSSSGEGVRSENEMAGL